MLNKRLIVIRCATSRDIIDGSKWNVWLCPSHHTCGLWTFSRHLCNRFPVIINSPEVPIETASVGVWRCFLNILGHTVIMRSAYPWCKNAAPRSLRCFFHPPRGKKEMSSYVETKDNKAKLANKQKK